MVLCSLALILIGSAHGISSQKIQAAQSVNEGMEDHMRIQTLLQEYVDDYGAVGASIGLIDQGIIKFFSYGKKSISGNEVISEDTVFEIGSITKVFTTLALMDMVAKGEVQLDDPIET